MLFSSHTCQQRTMTLPEHGSVLYPQASLQAEDRTEAEVSTSELLQRLQSVQALQEPGTARGQAEELQRGGDGGEELVGSHAKSGGRALAANVLWLDANPDARHELAQASPGVVSAKTSACAWCMDGGRQLTKYLLKKAGITEY